MEDTKPEPDLIEAALQKAGTRDAIMVGDTAWDIEAASRAGIGTLAVMTGGLSESELRGAGALSVYESVVEFMDDLDAVPAR